MLSTHGYFDPVPKLGQTDTGGQVVYVLELSKAISRLGIPVDIYTRWFDKQRKQTEPAPGHEHVRIVRIPAGPWEFVAKEQIYELLPELTENMLHFMKKEGLRYDLYHGHYVDAGMVTVEVAAATRSPSFFTAHSLGAWKREQMGGDTEVMEEKYNFSQRIREEMRIFQAVNAQTVTSIVQREKLNELYGLPTDNVAVIPPGVNIHIYKPPDKEDPGPRELPEKYIYCLSRIDANKGHDMLLRAFHRLSSMQPDVHLVIGGGSPDPKPREIEVFNMMKALTEELGIVDKVKLVGYVPDEKMVPYYQHSLFFVMPSLFEPFGMTTQEAMACGKTVIASKYGGIRNIIDHGTTGMLIDPKNSEEFADVMRRLVTDAPLRKSIGRQASLMIREEYSWERMAERHLDYYSEYL